MTISIANTSNTNTFEFWLTKTNQMAYALSNYVVTTDSNTSVGNASISGTFTANVVDANTVTGNNFIARSFYVGNTTVNGSINATALFFGNSTSNVSVNTTSLKFGTAAANVSLDASSLVFGNSTYQATINPDGWSISNATASYVFNMPDPAEVANGSFFLNADGSWQPAGSISETSIKYEVTTTGTSQQVIDSFSKTSYLAHEYTIIVRDSFANNRILSKIFMSHDGTNAFHTEYGMMSTNSNIGSFSSGSNTTHAILYFTPTTPGTTVSYIKVKI